MKSSEIRHAFLSYFEKNNHQSVKSASLVPNNDSTLYFTNAGMVPFKETFLGEESRNYTRACSSQKCMRVSGKHNDLENVGHTPRHHTFFEMLGNFSFGDYFKKEAIAYAWEFFTKVLNLTQDRLIVTVFRDDAEAYQLWKKHVPESRIFTLDEKDNFWSMGDTGPCGPCSEILWDFGDGGICANDLDSNRFMELWNLVFMQYSRSADGQMARLSAPCVDTGMGLERISAIMQGVQTNWESDVFQPIIQAIAQMLHVDDFTQPQMQIALRVIADHLRCATFLIGDGVIPSNEGRGYVLRRILRRAVRYGKRLDCHRPFMNQLIHVVIDKMGSAYPELVSHQQFIEKVIFSEEERFFETLDKGLELLKDEMKKSASQCLSGAIAFRLYDTFGFPLDVTELIAKENGFSVDHASFHDAMNVQRQRARANWKGSGEVAVDAVYKDLSQQEIKSNFLGYSKENSAANVIAIIHDGVIVDHASNGQEIAFITDQTPFYGESGGQIGDSGVAISNDGTGVVDIEITNTMRPLNDLFVHQGVIRRGKVTKDMMLTLAVNSEKRHSICCNHTATHIMHQVLREVLGEHVKQAGSLVSDKRLRFDFSHFQSLSTQELQAIEDKVNAIIRRNLLVITYELTYEEAVDKGALAFFGEKYSDRVRMIDISGFSKELCGGTHVNATGEIGLFKLISESSVAAGVRRIEAITASNAIDYVRDLECFQMDIAFALKSKPSESLDKVNKLKQRISELEKELQSAFESQHPHVEANSHVQKINNSHVLAEEVSVPNRNALGQLAEKYRDQLGDAVIVLAAQIDGKIAIVSTVSKSLHNRYHAGNLVKFVSEQVGGKGGGRAAFAQGGGSDYSKLNNALQSVYTFINDQEDV